jgi:ribonuclease H / adenosylcobalamin/alpha-ribazole phosphatase
VKDARLLAHTDGGVDTQGTYIGVLLVDLDTDEVLLERGEDGGPGTHNEAEYRALLCALRQAEALGADELIVKSDSKLIVNQVNGEWAVRQDHLKGYAQEAMRLMAVFPKSSLSWIPRKQNAIADRLTRVRRAGLA